MKPFIVRLVGVLLVVAATPACVGNIFGGNREVANSNENTSADAGDVDAGEIAGDPAVAPSALTRLTRIEYQRAVTSIFGTSLVANLNFDTLPADGNIGRFESNVDLNINIDSIDGYRVVAEDIGAMAGANAAVLMGCAEAPACVDAFIAKYGQLFYRRPLSTAEAAVFRGLWDSTRAQGTLSDAVRLTITAFLQTPDFLYRLEKGRAGDDGEFRRLSGYELASRLSFFLWKSTPDAELLAAAASGDLDTVAGLKIQAQRLLADPRADFTILRFHSAWLGIDALKTQPVDATQFPGFEALRSDMLSETDQFVLNVFRRDDAKIKTLLTADYSFASPALTTFYGAGVSSVGAAGRISLNPTQRKGIFTQASYLTSHARTPSRAAIYRGKSILIDVMCQHLVVPEGVNTAISFNPTQPARQQIEQATSATGCIGCHRSINAMGFAFENYDGVGKWRTVEAGAPVLATAVISGTDIDGPVTGAMDLLSKLGDSPEVAQCVSRQWLRFALSRPEADGDEGSVLKATSQAAGDMRELIVAITLSDSFRYRRIVP